MNKILKPLPFLFFALLLIVVSLQMSLIVPAFASPASATYNSSPTANVVTSLTVTNPTYAYNSDNATGAYLDYTETDGSFEVSSFTTLTDPWRIVKVDFKMRYSTTISSKDDVYRIVYYVGASGPFVLKDWTRDTHSIPGAGCDVWFSRTEPIDGVWSWTDVSNIKIVVEVNREGGSDSGGDFNEYETWVTVHYRGPTLYVDPTSLTVGAPFTIDINITNMDDLYTWEFNVTYDTSILTATNVLEGPFLNASNTKTSHFNKTINDANGWVYAYCSLVGDIAGTSGGGVLATIAFSIDSTGVSALDLHNSKLVEYDYIAKKTYNYPPNHLAEVDGSITTTAVPEFPLGAAMEIALVAVIIYLWWRHKREPKPSTFIHKST